MDFSIGIKITKTAANNNAYVHLLAVRTHAYVARNDTIFVKVVFSIIVLIKFSSYRHSGETTFHPYGDYLAGI